MRRQQHDVPLSKLTPCVGRFKRNDTLTNPYSHAFFMGLELHPLLVFPSSLHFRLYTFLCPSDPGPFLDYSLSEPAEQKGPKGEIH